MSETALATPSYLFLKLSQALFKKSPAALDAAERARVEQVARRQQAIEQCILASPEAAQVQVPTTSVDQALGEIRQRYRDSAEWHADMENAGLDEAGLRAAIERDLRFEACSNVSAVQNRKPAIPMPRSSICCIAKNSGARKTARCVIFW